MTSWGAVGAALALAVLCVVLVGRAQAQVATADEQAFTSQTKQLDEARRDLEASALNIVVARMLQGVSIGGDHSERLESASDRFAAAAGSIRALAAEDGPVGAEASSLLDDLDADLLDDPVGGDVRLLFAIAEDTARWSANDGLVDTRQAAIQELSFVSSLPLHVMVEAIAADISVNERVVDPSIADSVDVVVDIVRNDGGRYGQDATLPLNNSIWIEIDESSELLPAAAQQMNETTAASSLVAYDAWARVLNDADTPPPMEIIDALNEADRLTGELSMLIDELFATEAAAEIGVVADQQAKRQRLFVAAALAALMSAPLGVVGTRSLVRSGRSARHGAELAMRDALTGIGNRHELEHRTRALTLDPRFGHHLVAMIDLDRFKMVNDVYGHGAGDATLIEIAARLKRVAERIENNQPDIETSVIRLGGDEFLLTALGERAFDVEAIIAEMDSVRSDFIEHEGAQIELAFSVGVCHVEGQHELADVMLVADQAAYREKAERARERSAAGTRGAGTRIGAALSPEVPLSQRA